MSAVNKDIERLIVRSLDGALSADEELELNREILRNPQAHRLLEDYRRIDEFSSAVLDRVVPAKETVVVPATSDRRREPRRAGRSHPVWWLLPGAMAAALAAAVVYGPGVIPPPGRESTDESWKKLSETPPAHTFTNGINGAAQHRVSDTTPRRRVTRDIYRDVFGVVGEDGNIYWIEVDRTRTIKRPYSRSSRRRSAGEL